MPLPPTQGCAVLPDGYLGAMADPEGSPSDEDTLAWLIDLNSKVGAIRLRAMTSLLRAGSSIVPQILSVLRGQEQAIMTTLWGEVLLQIVYAQHLDAHRGALQEAYFHRQGVAQRVLFEARGVEFLDFWIACLSAPRWEVREESALILGAMGRAAESALEPMRDALAVEEHDEARRTMQRALQQIAAE